MTKPSAFPHGAFCWIDLGTRNPKSAIEFYSKLFGWTTSDMEMPGGGKYSMFNLGSDAVGGVYELSSDMKSKGVPSNWMSYINVDDIDAIGNKAKDLGANVVVPPVEVQGKGKFSCISDPTGAVVGLWQAFENSGAEKFDMRPGTFCWNELLTNDVDRAGKFYGELLPWNPHVEDMGSMKYTMFKNQGSPAAGMMPINKEWGDVPPNWLIYFSVEDCERSVDKCKELGGRVLSEPSDIPNVGRMSVLQDPEGVTFAVIKLVK